MTVIFQYVLMAAPLLLRWALILYVLYAVIASSLPCLPYMRAHAGKPNPFVNTNYYGNGTAGPDRIALLESPVEGLGIRLQLFRTATRTLDVVLHTIHEGVSTHAFFDGLQQAANRGVRVRILLDGKASSIRPSVNTLMKALDGHENIEVRRYNPINLLTPWKWHFLMHDKFIVVDGEYLLLGGRNLGDKFFAVDGYSGKLSNDRDVLVWKADQSQPEGASVVDQAGTYMNSLWDYEDTRPMSGRAMRTARRDEMLAELHATAQQFEETHPAYFRVSLSQYLSLSETTRKITLIFNPIETCRKEPWIGEQMIRMATGAKESVMLQTPYITANRTILYGLEKVAKNVNLSVLTNSAASTPNYPAYSNYYSQRQKFIDTGAQIYEYQSRHSIHGKAMTVDGRLGIVGSFNLDDRSMHLDTEIMMVVDSESFTGKLTGAIEEYKAQSLRVNAANEYDIPEGTEQETVPTFKTSLLMFVALFSTPLRAFI